MQCNQAPYRDSAHCEAELDCYGLPQLQMSASDGGVLYDPGQVGACNARFLADPCGFAFFLFTPDIFQVLSYCPGGDHASAHGRRVVRFQRGMRGGALLQEGHGMPRDMHAFRKGRRVVRRSDLCDPKLRCKTTSTTPSTELCEAPSQAGDPCKGAGDCGSTENCPAAPASCSNVNLWCDATSGSCKPGVGLGAACGQQTSGSIACASNLWCDQVFIDQPGACRASGGAGAPCNDLGCDVGLHCAGYIPLGMAATLGTCMGLSSAGWSVQVEQRLPRGNVLWQRHMWREKRSVQRVSKRRTVRLASRARPACASMRPTRVMHATARRRSACSASAATARASTMPRSGRRAWSTRMAQARPVFRVLVQIPRCAPCAKHLR